MTLDVVGTLSTNKKSNKQKETKTLYFSMMSYGITRTVMGSGSILLNRKPQNGFQGSEKKKHVIVVSEDTKSIKYRQKNDSSKKFPHNQCFESNYLICIYVHM